MIACGQVTEESVTHARTEQDAYETNYRFTELRKQAGLAQKDVVAAVHDTEVTLQIPAGVLG